MTTPSHDHWQRAAAFAARAHKHQLRKDGETPYVSHPFRVAMTVRHVFGCEDPVAIAAALLHDTIEDTATDYDDIAEGFGTQVADVVAAMTKSMILPEHLREVDYDTRLAKADWRARLIKLADVYDNACDCAQLTPESKAKLPVKIDRAVALAAADRAGNPVMERAASAVQALIASRSDLRR